MTAKTRKRRSYTEDFNRDALALVTEHGFITMNMPQLVGVLESCGIKNPIICASINTIDFRMSRVRELYEKTLAEREFRPIARQVLAAGAIPPAEAMDCVCSQSNIRSTLFGATTKNHS